MKFSKPIACLLLIVGLGLAMVIFYGLPNILSDNTSLERAMRGCSVLFLFGAWAGVVILTENRSWRYWTNAVLFTLLGFYTAEILSNPSVTNLQIILPVCFVVGFLGTDGFKEFENPCLFRRGSSHPAAMLQLIRFRRIFHT